MVFKRVIIIIDIQLDPATTEHNKMLIIKGMKESNVSMNCNDAALR